MLYLLVCLLAAISPAQCQTEGMTPPPSISSAVNTLGFRLLNELTKIAPDENVVFSPLSISSAFSLVYFGARGETKDEMEAVFGFQGGVVPGELNEKAAEFGQGLSQIARIANRAYIADNLQILDAFREAIGGMNIQIAPFGDPPQAIEQINSWVEDVTKGLIKDLLSLDAISAATRLVLVNAIYFEGSWLFPFDKADTKPARFHGVNGSPFTDFMSLRNTVFRTKRIQKLNSQMIELPYKGNRFSMFILLPTKSFFATAEAKAGELGAHLFKGLESREFSLVRIPKWELEQSMDLIKQFLQNLGVKILFSTASDLSGITASEPLMATDVVHKAKITVDEEGTTAAAATAVILPLSLPPPADEDFEADRPFLYFIVDKNDGSIVFQGSVKKF